MTPFQANLSYEEGANLIKHAYNKGVNFIDTAEIYGNYEYIRRAFKDIDRENIVIATKTYAYTEEMAKASLEMALEELDTDYIDIFLLHEQESIHTVRGHWEAIEYFKRAKQEGKIKAIGISTHRISGLDAVIELDDLEVIHPIVNIDGIGIQDGSIEEMLEKLKILKSKGKGIYSMKPLGGGHLIKDYEKAINFIKNVDTIDSIAIGMQSIDEIDANIKMLENKSIPDEIKQNLRKKDRRLIVADYCIACGNCVERCQQNGIEIIDGQAVANDKCILCGYCANVCPEFCIKVI